ncbi:acyltransferase family protein [Nioella aestuarii]|uniref:acyltransferase family protein n=1 Tax=Nioella aestuarii TaxID=1662864 RepID=UPI003D7F3A03
MTMAYHTLPSGSSRVADHQKEKSTNRYGGIDVARLALALLVVLAHCATFQAVSPAAHFLFNNGLARIIVPFFLLTTGYFFDRQMAKGLGPWLWRVGRVYVIWTLIFLPYILFLQEVTPMRLILTALFGYFHLWYLPALIGGMVVLYLARNLSDWALMALAAGLFIVGGVIQYAENALLDFSTLSNHYDLLVITRNFLFYGFPYLALGTLLHRGRLLANSRPETRQWMVAGAGLLLLAETWLAYLAFSPEGFFDLNFAAFLLTPILFVWARDLKIGNLPFDPRHLSMVIYLTHMLYLVPLRIFTGLETVQLTAVTLVLTLGLAPVWLKIARRVPILA